VNPPVSSTETVTFFVTGQTRLAGKVPPGALVQTGLDGAATYAVRGDAMRLVRRALADAREYRRLRHEAAELPDDLDRIADYEGLYDQISGDEGGDAGDGTT
jgi:hypothetical protein